MDFEWKSNHRIQEQDMNLIDKVVAEYRKSYSNDDAMVGAMAYTIGMQKNRIDELEKLLNGLS